MFVFHGFGSAVKKPSIGWFPVDLRVKSGAISDNHHSKKGKFTVVFEFLCETDLGVDFIQCRQVFRGR